MKLLQTTDYQKFELHRFNRNVEKIKKLEESMVEHGWLDPYPMHTIRSQNGKLLIKAGHHRFQVAQKLGIPVKYVISQDDASIYELEAATRPWLMNDYLVSHIREGINSNYLIVRDYHERTGIKLPLCISLLAGETAGSSNRSKSFKRGNYAVNFTQYAADVEDMIK